MPHHSHPLSGLLTIFGLIALAGLVLISSLPKAATIVFCWPWAFYAQAVLLVPFALLAWAYSQSTPKRSRAGIAGFALAAAIGLSVATSRQPHFSFEAALPLWSGIAFLWWIAQHLRRGWDDDRNFLRFARVAGAAMAVPLLVSAGLYAVNVRDLLVAAGDAPIDWVGNRNPHPLGHWNYTGGLSVLTFPWLAGLAWYERRRWRWAWLLAVLLSASAFFTAASRGAVIGALAGVAASGGLLLSLHRPSRRQWLGLMAGGLIALGLLLATNSRFRSLVTDPGAVLQPTEGDVQRLGMLQGGWLLGQERPWVGHGPGMVPFVYPEVRARLVGGVETSYQLHCAPLHWWATTGLLGFGALATLFGLLLREWWCWRREPASLRRGFSLIGGVALIAYAGLSLTDYQLYVIPLVALLALYAGTLLGRPSADTAPGRRPLLLPALLGLGGVGALAVLVPHWQAHSLHWEALAGTPGTERVALAQKMMASVAAAPWSTHYRNQAGFQLARAAGESRAPALRLSARQVLGSSLAIDPAQEPVHAALGWLWLPDDPAPARAHFERALQLLPDRPATHLGLALSCLAQGDRDSCVQALAMETLINPFFVASPYWLQEPLQSLREPVYSRWLALTECALSDPKLPPWRRPPFVYARAVARWWREGRQPSAEELGAATAPARQVFEALGAQRGEGPLPASWAALREALLDRGGNALPLKERLPGLPEETALAAQLRLENLQEHTLEALLRSPAAKGTPVVNMKVDRGHYPLMYRSVDGPGYADLAPYQDDPFLVEFVAPLFPVRGLLPGPVVTALEHAKP